jgi:phosphohistidine phosphatase
MRTLFILRHGEATPSQGVVDRDRELTPAGLRAMQDLARIIESMDNAPTTALCSPTMRTRQTCRAVAAGIPVQIYEDMYDATIDRLVRFVHGIDDSHKSALLVGHNPGVHQLAAMLSRAGDDKLRQSLATEYRPGTLAVVRARTLQWANFTPDLSEIIDLRVPPFAA